MPVGLEQLVYCCLVWKIVWKWLRQTQRLAGMNEPLKLQRECCGSLIPGPEGLEQSKAVLERMIVRGDQE